MTAVRVFIATMVTVYLLSFDVHVINFLYAFLFYDNYELLVYGPPAAWKVIIFSAVFYLTAYPLLITLISMIIGLKKVTYVFKSVAAISILLAIAAWIWAEDFQMTFVRIVILVILAFFAAIPNDAVPTGSGSNKR